MKPVAPAILQALSAATHHLNQAEELARDPEACSRKLHSSLKKTAASAAEFLDGAHAVQDDPPSERK